MKRNVHYMFVPCSTGIYWLIGPEHTLIQQPKVTVLHINHLALLSHDKPSKRMLTVIAAIFKVFTRRRIWLHFFRFFFSDVYKRTNRNQLCDLQYNICIISGWRHLRIWSKAIIRMLYTSTTDLSTSQLYQIPSEATLSVINSSPSNGLHCHSRHVCVMLLTCTVAPNSGVSPETPGRLSNPLSFWFFLNLFVLELSSYSTKRQPGLLYKGSTLCKGTLISKY